MKSAFQTYTTVEQQVKDFEESFREAEIKFNAGAINSVEYLIAKNNFDQANLNLIIAKYDYDGRKCMELRQQWWQQGKEQNWSFLFYHDIKTPVFSFK